MTTILLNGWESEAILCWKLLDRFPVFPREGETFKGWDVWKNQDEHDFTTLLGSPARKDWDLRSWNQEQAKWSTNKVCSDSMPSGSPLHPSMETSDVCHYDTTKRNTWNPKPGSFKCSAAVRVAIPPPLRNVRFEDRHISPSREVDSTHHLHNFMWINPVSSYHHFLIFSPNIMPFIISRQICLHKAIWLMLPFQHKVDICLQKISIVHFGWWNRGKLIFSQSSSRWKKCEHDWNEHQDIFIHGRKMK